MRSAVVLVALVSCARVVELSPPEGVERIAWVTIDAAGEARGLSGLIEVTEALPGIGEVGDARVFAIGFERAQIEALEAPDRASLEGEVLVAAKPCEVTVGRPVWVAEIGESRVAEREAAVIPRMTAPWLRKRCACDARVKPEQFEVTSYAVPDTIGAWSKKFAIALDERTVFLAAGEGRFFRATKSGLAPVKNRSLPEQAAFRDEYGRLWIIGSNGLFVRGDLEGGFEQLLGLAGEAFAITGSAEGIFAMTSDGQFAHFQGGAWTPLAWFASSIGFDRAPAIATMPAGEVVASLSLPTDESPDREAHAFVRRKNGDIDDVVFAPLRDHRRLGFIAAHPELGLLLSSYENDSGLFASTTLGDSLDDWISLIRPGVEQQAFTAIAPFESGVLRGDQLGRIFWSSPEQGETEFPETILIPRNIIPLAHGFAVTARNVTNLEGETPTELTVFLYTRRGCFGLPTN